MIFKLFFNDSKTVISILVKERLAVVKEDELRMMGKSRGKTMENTSINLYCIHFFYCNKKIVKNRTRTSAPTYIVKSKRW